MNQAIMLTNSLLIANLNADTNEDRISSSIKELRNEINKIESFSGPSIRTYSMRDEIAKLEEELDSCKIPGSILTLQLRETKSYF